MCRKELIFAFFTIAVAFGYDVGVNHRYSYNTLTTLDEQCLGESEKQIVGQKLQATVSLTAVWQNPQLPAQQLIKIEISDAKLQVPKKNVLTDHSSQLDKISPKASFVLRQEGVVTKLWEDPAENYAIRNIKKGIASLLNIQKKDAFLREVDVAGNCQTNYEVKGVNIQKRKSHCIHPQFDSSLSQPFGVRSASANHLLVTDCKLTAEKSDTLEECVGGEYIKTFSNVWRTTSLCVNAKSQLNLVKSAKGSEIYTQADIGTVIDQLKKSVGNLEEGSLEAVISSQETSSQSKLEDILKKYQDSLKSTNLAKLKSALAFYKLLPYFRSASKEDISKILQNDKFNKIKGQILDLIAATSQEQTLQAVFEHFQGLNNYDEMLERFLISLSVTPKPSEQVLNQIKAFLDSKTHHDKIYATLISTFGAVLKTYSQQYFIAKDEVISSSLTYMEKKLKKCESESCIQSTLKGFRNAASPVSIPLLIEYALKGGKPALEAMLAIRNVDVRLIPIEIQDQLLKVFLQVGAKQDRSTRSIVADILLDLDPKDDVLRSVLNVLSDQSDEEFATFISSKIAQKSEQNKELRRQIFKLLSERHISYYYSLAQKGSSSLFTKPLVNSEGINVTYGIEMEMLAGNLLKRSVFDVNFESLDVSNFITVTMFGEGIASLAGGSSDEDVSPSAGMELTLLGSSLRPYIFFTGTSELMGHAWSGTASTPTPALQGIFSFSDDETLIVTHNGLIVQIHLRGVLSADLSASVQISLWSQNSQSQVKNAGALLMRGAVIIDSGFSVIQGAYQFSGQSAIDFDTNLVFSSSPFQMCLKMEHPAIIVKQDTHRSITVTETTYILKKTKKRKRELPSRSYALHERNNEQCRQLN